MPTSSPDHMIPIHIKLQPQMLQELREINKRTGTPISEFIRRALRPAIARELKQKTNPA